MRLQTNQKRRKRFDLSALSWSSKKSSKGNWMGLAIHFKGRRTKVVIYLKYFRATYL